VPRAKKIADAWVQRQDAIQHKLDDVGSPPSIIANQLGWIIGGFCLFALVLFVLLRWFPENVQVELVASGQVIQFATVMVLLIVICVLGISKYLSENTLGTLLGGIGGYVLSQGVGRAAARATQTAAVAAQIAASHAGATSSTNMTVTPP
jgi:hypothetical protein